LVQVSISTRVFQSKGIFMSLAFASLAKVQTLQSMGLVPKKKQKVNCGILADLPN
jgi:hypothetical protein